MILGRYRLEIAPTEIIIHISDMTISLSVEHHRYSEMRSALQLIETLRGEGKPIARMSQYYKIKNFCRHCENRVLLQEHLQLSVCQDCGLADARVLQFDHQKNKKFNIADGISRKSWKRVWEEMKKCDIVCANCHQIRTMKSQVSHKYQKHFNVVD